MHSLLGVCSAWCHICSLPILRDHVEIWISNSILEICSVAIWNTTVGRDVAPLEKDLVTVDSGWQLKLHIKINGDWHPFQVTALWVSVILWHPVQLVTDKLQPVVRVVETGLGRGVTIWTHGETDVAIVVSSVMVFNRDSISRREDILALPRHFIADRIAVVSIACAAVFLAANATLFIGVETLTQNNC